MKTSSKIAVALLLCNLGMVSFQASAQVDAQKDDAQRGWQPGHWSCDQQVKRPIADAWRAANYLDEQIADIKDALALGGDCPGEEMLNRMDTMIRDTWDPARVALSRLSDCKKYLSPGLYDLLVKRSSDLDDRLFDLQKDIAFLFVCR